VGVSHIVPEQHNEIELREAVELRVVVTRLYRILRAKSAAKLTASQVSALVRIEEEGPLRLTTLAEREGIAAPTMSKVVDLLCDEGLIERIPDPTDGRANLIQLDEGGQALLRDVRERLTRLMREALEHLSDEEHEILAAAIPVLQHVIEVMRGDG
jgi:DNA-binding MarR family transcriptional regulator